MSVKHGTTFVTVQGRKTQLTTGGDGPPLVYLHSAGGETDWMPFHDGLAERFQVFLPAHPGFALSGGLDDIRDIYESSGFAAEGGVTARLLLLELEHAQPFLVPFLHWASTLDIQPSAEQIERFRDFYDPAEPMRSFFARLERLTHRDNIGWNSNG